MVPGRLQAAKAYWVIPVLLALLVNQNVLQNGFGWDDEIFILAHQSPDRWMSLILPHLSTNIPKDNTPYFRPVVPVTYEIEYLIWGKRPFGYHLSVWAAHILNTALVFFLARGLIPVATGTLGFAPLLAASLFAVHPIHAEAVAWIAGRNDVFCATFILLSMVLYIRFHRTGSRLIFGLSMLAFLLALLTKETAVGLVVLFPFYDYLSAPKDSPDLYRRIGIRWMLPLGVFGLYFWMRTVSIEFAYGEVSTQKLLPDPNQPAILRAMGGFGYYLKMMVFPYPHNPFIADLPASRMLVFFSGIALTVVLGGVVYALVRRRVVLGIGLVWTLAILTPAVAATVLNLASASVAERYVYAPTAGFLIAGAWLFLTGIERWPSVIGGSQKKVWTWAGLICIAVVMIGGLESWHRNTVWRNPVTFWRAAVAAAPESGYPSRALGVQYELAGQNAEAERLYKRAIAIDEKTLGADHGEVAWNLNNLAVFYFNQSRYSEAEPIYRRALMISEKIQGPDQSGAAINFHNLAVLYRNQGRYAEAEQLLKRSIEIQERISGPNHPAVAAGLDNLGLVYVAQGRNDQAESVFRKSLVIWEKSFGPNHSVVATTLEHYADLLRKMKRNAEAEKMEARAADIRNKQAREQP
jgi:Tfp pilus assembly protein PilF